MEKSRLESWLSADSPLGAACREIKRDGLAPEYVFAQWLAALIKERGAAEREKLKEMCADELYDKGFGAGFKEGQRHAARPLDSPAPSPSSPPPPEPAPSAAASLKLSS